ncbi:MAG: sigma-54 dependent transcriptional regulator [Ignavibacteriales bacterium]
MKETLLLVDNDKEFLADITLLLQNKYNCLTTNDEESAIKLLRKFSPDVILLDLMLDDGVSGLDVLKKIKDEDDSIPVIMMTDYGSVETAVEAIKIGAFDYISKTPNLSELNLLINKSLQQRLIKFQTESFQNEVNKPYQTIVGKSPAILKVKEHISAFAQSDNTILITGESGVGKELVARQMHQQSRRKNKPFIAINCGALPKDLIESELFGYEKGAFTGAVKKTPGKFEIAEGGSIFLDEISELDPLAQVKFLRILQEKEFQPVGSSKTMKTDVKVIVATNKNLYEMVQKGLFREDLYYRLDVLPINVPPLRERKEDIPLLAEYFSESISKELGKPKKKFSESSLQLLQNYDWPGNIRELQNYINRVYFLSDKILVLPEDLNFSLQKKIQDNFFVDEIPQTWERMNEMRREASEKAARKVEKLFVDFLLKKFDGNITKAAEHAGINRTNLHKMISKINDEKED